MWGNAICERIIGTLRRELFDRLLIINERHLRQVLTEYLEHYNTARPHRGLGQLTPAQADDRSSCLQGPPRSPGSRAARRAVARSAMRSTLEAGGAAP